MEQMETLFMLKEKFEEDKFKREEVTQNVDKAINGLLFVHFFSI